MKHFTEICEPYAFEKENANTGQVEIVKKLTDCINGERSLLAFVNKFLSSGKNEVGGGVTDTNNGDSSEEEDQDDDSSDDDD
jgi:hypothetical protein